MRVGDFYDGTWHNATSVIGLVIDWLKKSQKNVNKVLYI